MTDSLEAFYNTKLQGLDTEVAKISSIGSHFFVDSIIPTTMPNVEIKKVVNSVSTPATEDDIKKIIESATLAPTGDAVDEKLRKVWQVDSKHVKLTNFNDTLANMLVKISEALGMSGEKIKANLSKMLVYDKGCFSLPRSDKEDKTFGTLVISLPAIHSGGDVVIRHSGREDTVTLQNSSLGSLRYCAFYSDCEYEVKEITDGHRLCLVYNLSKTGKRSLVEQDVGGIVKSQDSIKNAEFLLQTALSTSDQIVYVLENSYSPNTFQFKKLKGKDQSIAMLLQSFAGRLQCNVYLGIIGIEESGTLTNDKAKASDIPKTNLGVKLNGDIVDTYFTVNFSKVVNMQGKEEPGLQLRIQPGNLYPVNSLYDTSCDKKSITEVTEKGTNYEKVYRRYSVILKKIAGATSDNNNNTTATATTTTTTATSTSSNGDTDETHQTKKVKLDNQTTTTTTASTENQQPQQPQPIIADQPTKQPQQEQEQQPQQQQPEQPQQP
ncbi:serine/threonine protein kinase [Tieghemostelium lacteum]|uniref:Serine/threonine protein kinase n=1 Tax=Tieghemostelium lacteum TaxID=361077 RepID=A0A152A1R2_TIELA|nr:serine/threonine protein kinase [Tieghemostelium lacteum]|eukprot:KYR00166.1 serine/threonine protein kinase [Tieghemostelium lacteum]